MSDAAQIELVRALPGIILAVVLAGLVVWLRHPLREKVLPRVSGIKVLWLEVTLIQQDVSRSEQLAIAEKETDLLARWRGFDPDAQETLVKRAEALAPILRGASVLWVDDRPQFNNAERNILGRLGVSVDIVTSSGEALALMAGTDTANDYDVIISDIDRPGEGAEGAGLALLSALREKGYRHPVIFYVGTMKPGTPRGAFGICAHAAELFRLTFDALERSRACCA